MPDFERAGEIIEVGQVIHPIIAEAVGTALVRKHAQLVPEKELEPDLYYGFVPYEYKDYEFGDVGVDLPRNLKSLDAEVYRIGEKFLKDLLAARDEDTSGLRHAGDFSVNSPGECIWHVNDPSYILLVNLARMPQTLRYAKTWEETKNEHEVAPTEIDEYTFVTGAGLLLYNPTNLQDRVPHAGVSMPGKVFMRRYAMPPRTA